MRLADPRRPQQQQRLAMRHPAAGGELADLPRIERGLRGKVEAVEIAHRREVSDLAGHRDAPLVFAGNLPFHQKGERLAQRQLALGGLVQQAVELVADRGELEPRQSRQQAHVIDGHDQPPPTTRSYSASGRSSAGSGKATAAGSTAHTGRTTPATP